VRRPCVWGSARFSIKLCRQYCTLLRRPHFAMAHPPPANPSLLELLAQVSDFQVLADDAAVTTAFAENRVVPTTQIVPFALPRPYAHPLPCGSIFTFSGASCPLLCFLLWKSAQFWRQNPAIPSSTRLHASAPATSSETADLLHRQPMRPFPRQGTAGLSCALNRPDSLKRPPTCESGARLGPHPGSLRGHRDTSASLQVAAIYGGCRI
jgi:hypothetical protein